MDVLLLEDHPAARAAIADGLRRHGIQVVPVGTIADAERAVNEGFRGIALVDLRLSGESGFDAIAWLTDQAIPCIALTNLADAASLGQAIRRGARGYLLKDDPVIEVAAALRRVLDGGQPLSPGVTHHLLHAFRTPPHALPYTLDVALHDGHVSLSRPDSHDVATFRSEAQVNLLYALAKRWSADGAGDGRGWMDDSDVAQAIWGAKHREHGTNNLNVLIFRVRAQAAEHGFDKGLIEKRAGQTRLNVGDVHLT